MTLRKAVGAFTIIMGVGFVPVSVPAGAQTHLCIPPAGPFPDKLAPSDPLYETARDAHQEQLEAMEDYINCLDREREASLSLMEDSFSLFLRNFGEDGLFRLKEARFGDGNAVIEADDDGAAPNGASAAAAAPSHQPSAGPQDPVGTPPPPSPTRLIDPNRRVRVIR